MLLSSTSFSFEYLNYGNRLVQETTGNIQELFKFLFRKSALPFSNVQGNRST